MKRVLFILFTCLLAVVLMAQDCGVENGVGNRPPFIQEIIGEGKVAVGESITLVAVASDADGDSIEYTWVATNDLGLSVSGKVLNKVVGNQVEFTASLSAGIYNVCVSASDGSETSRKCIEITVVGDCTGFDYQKAEVQNVDGRWKIVVGNMLLLDFGDSKEEADRALSIIKHYGMNQQCFVGLPDPSMDYYLVDGQAPAGAFRGEDSISFNPDRIEVTNIGGRWKIVEGNHAMMDFDTKEDEARRAFEIIKEYGFRYICFVGRPDPSMTYFRK